MTVEDIARDLSVAEDTGKNIELRLSIMNASYNSAGQSMATSKREIDNRLGC